MLQVAKKFHLKSICNGIHNLIYFHMHILELHNM